MIKNWGAFFALLALVALPGIGWELTRSAPSPIPYASTDHSHGATKKNDKPADYMGTALTLGEFVDAHNGAVSAIAAIITALFTVVLAWKTWGLNEATKGLQRLAASQGEDMKNSIAEASRSALAMERISEGIGETVKINKSVIEHQKDFWTRQMRAYVSVDTGGDRRQKGGFRFEFKPNITNSGMTPANNLYVYSKCEIVSEVPTEDFDFTMGFEGTGAPSRTTLFPRQTKFHSNVFRRKCTITEMRMLLRGKAAFHLWGKVSYEDAFQKPRYTNFSFLIYLPINKRGTPTWHTSDRHNDAN